MPLPLKAPSVEKYDGFKTPPMSYAELPVTVGVLLGVEVGDGEVVCEAVGADFDLRRSTIKRRS